MKVALVYDRVNKWGGAERVLLALHKLFPKAPLYTSVYNPKTASWAEVFPKVIPSFLQKLPYATHHELYATFMPLAFERFNFDNYDLVISVTSEAAKGIVTKSHTFHLCYCLTPTRYLWSGYDDYFKDQTFKILSKPAVSYLKKWDKSASNRPDAYVAISKEVQRRIKKYYGRESVVIYPSVSPLDASRLPHVANDVRPPSKDSKKFLPSSLSERRPPKANLNPNIKTRSAFSSFASGQAPTMLNDGYFLVVSRLVPYKRIDIAIEAFNKLGLPLKIIGTGSEEKKLKAMANKNIEFMGSLTDQQLIRYYKDCFALIFPSKEDFGLVALEAQGFGKPVIAYKGGGALETVIEGKTGLFFEKQEADSLVEKIKQFKKLTFKSEDCLAQAKKFSEKKFQKEIKDLIERLTKKKS